MKTEHEIIECPRCATMVKGECHQSGHQQTWLWRCACGWGRVVADSGVLDRARFQDALEERRRRRKRSGTISAVDGSAADEVAEDLADEA